MPLNIWLFGARRRGLQQSVLALAVTAIVIIFYLQKHGPLAAVRVEKELGPTYWLPAAGNTRLKKISPTDDAKTNQKPNVIPRILHQTWKSQAIPETMRPWVTSWLKQNPDMEYWFWTDEDMRNLISTKFPKFLKFYDSYPETAYRVDAFRYFVLYAFGGVYADLDMECLRSLEDILKTHDCFVSQEPVVHGHFLSTMGPPLVSNALMACRPGHPFFHHLITDLKSYAGVWQWKDVLKATGPNMLTEVYRGYHRGGWFGWSQPSNPIYLADPKLFHPVPDESMVPRMQEMCAYSHGKDLLSKKYSERQEALCGKLMEYDYQAKPGKDSFTTHHWTHTWAGDKHDPWGIRGQSSHTFDVSKLREVRR